MVELSLTKQTPHLLRRAYQKGISTFSQHFADFDITALQFTVLIALGELKTCTQKELSEAIAVEPSNVHPLLKRMQRDDLLSVKPNPDDKRRSQIKLTAKGQKLLDTLWPVHLEAREDFEHTLSEKEQITLIKLLTKLVSDCPNEVQDNTDMTNENYSL